MCFLDFFFFRISLSIKTFHFPQKIYISNIIIVVAVTVVIVLVLLYNKVQDTKTSAALHYPLLITNPIQSSLITLLVWFSTYGSPFEPNSYEVVK